MARKGRKRRFREARDFKRGFHDDLFTEDDRTLADLHEPAHPDVQRDDRSPPTSSPAVSDASDDS
jgi:hypothetical protein